MVRFITLVTAVCLVAVSAFAGHVDTYGIGSKATSMGGAMTAGTDDPFSVYYNPAAMTKIKKPTFAIGAHLVDPSLKIDRFNAETTSAFGNEELTASGVKDQAPMLIAPHIGYVHPISDKLVLGVAVYVPYGLELEWDKNTTNNPAAYNTFHSWYVREVITPSVAYKVNDKLSLGFGVSIGKSEAGTERVRYVPEYMKNEAVWQAALTQQGVPAAAIPSMAAAQAAAYTELDGAQYKTEVEDSFNYSFNFGVHYQFNEKLAFGATFRSKSDTKMDGGTDVTPDLTIWQNQNVDGYVELDTPNQLQLGVQYMPTPKLNLNFDMTRTWWGSIKSYTMKFDDPFMATPPISEGAEEEHYERNWKNTWQYRFGAEYSVNDMIDIRAGYYYDPTVVPNDTFDVLWPDSDKHVFSAGLGLNFGRVSVDTVIQYIKIEDVTISGESENLNDSFTRPGVHEGDVSAKASGSLMSYGVTVNYSF